MNKYFNVLLEFDANKIRNKIEYNILHNGESYDYLLNLSYRKMNDASYKNNIDKLIHNHNFIKTYSEKKVEENYFLNLINENK